MQKEAIASVIWANLKEGIEIYGSTKIPLYKLTEKTRTMDIFEKTPTKEETLHFGMLLCRMIIFCEEYFDVEIDVDWRVNEEFELFNDLGTIITYMVKRVVEGRMEKGIIHSIYA